MTLSKKAKGTLWIIAAVIIGIPILVILIILLNLNSFVRTGIQVGGTRALGVETRLDSAAVSLWGRSIALRGLDVANPKGFSSPTFVKAGLISVSAELGALRKKEIHLYLVRLDGPEITYEIAKPKSNVAALMDNLKGNEQAPQPAGEKGKPVKLKIDRLTMSNVKVHVAVMGKPLDVSLGTVVINNLDDGHGNAIPTDQVLSAVLAKLTGSITDEVAGLPKGVTKDILPGLKKETGDLPENLKKTGQGLGSEIKKFFGN
jgi:uncharacterized protein involved in outer membrane biogenesis